MNEWAAKLREIADKFECPPERIGFEVSNEHQNKVAAATIHTIVDCGLLPDQSPDDQFIANRDNGFLNWHAIRKHARVVDSVSEFDGPLPKTKTERFVRGDISNGIESLEHGKITRELTPEERENWAKSQALAHAATLRRLACRIEESESNDSKLSAILQCWNDGGTWANCVRAEGFGNSDVERNNCEKP